MFNCSKQVAVSSKTFGEKTIESEQAIIRKIRLKNFRSFDSKTFEFSPGINVICGENGIGKTNLLEALYFISTGRSFRTTNISELIRHEAEFFRLEAIFEKCSIEQVIGIFYDGNTKKIQHNSTFYPGFSNLLGLLPSTLYCPLDIQLITGSPSQKRRFLNLQIAQQNSTYLIHLARYHRALKQRNALLKQKKTVSIEVWEAELIKHALPIYEARKEHLTELSTLLQKQIDTLIHQKWETLITYSPSTKSPLSSELFDRTRSKELQFGHTLYGPHRDDFHIILNGALAKSFASEGEKRILITSLKLAAHFASGFSIFSIDDFGAHLDPAKIEILEKTLQHLPQVFLTTTTPLKMIEPSVSIDLSTFFTVK